ncbi:MAG: hypothetical protein N2745_07820 [Syntrophorhabdaceae bacterium]|nr:hypothetical protein [Syntrophorhabdaceae bacterium]
MQRFCRIFFITSLFTLLFIIPLFTPNTSGMSVKPKEPGMYIMTEKSLVRLMPNILFNDQGLLYVEMNKPPVFMLKDVKYFVAYGKYDMRVYTINPLVYYTTSPLGKQRFILDKDLDITIENMGDDLYIIKLKSLLGRGYYCIWIEDQVWDFMIQ